jgi:hypothetical protein
VAAAVVVALTAMNMEVMEALGATPRLEKMAVTLPYIMQVALPLAEEAVRIHRGEVREVEMQAPQWQVARFQVVLELGSQEALAVAVPLDRPMVVQVVTTMVAQRAALAVAEETVTTEVAVVVAIVMTLALAVVAARRSQMPQVLTQTPYPEAAGQQQIQVTTTTLAMLARVL